MTAPDIVDGVRTGRRHGAMILRAAVTIALVAALAWAVDLRAAARLLAGASLAPLLIGVLLAFADRMLMAGKWYPLLHAQAPDVPLGRAVRAYLAASFAATFLPSSVGGDVLRTVALSRGRGRALEVGVSIVVARALGLFGLTLAALLATVAGTRLAPRFGGLLPYAVAAMLVAVAIAALLFTGAGRSTADRVAGLLPGARLPALATRLLASLGAYRGRGVTLGVASVLSFLEQGLPVLVLWVCSLALRLDVPLLALAVTVPLALFVARMPVSFGGLGLLEGSLVFLLGVLGIPAAEAVAIGLAGRVVGLLAALPGALWWGDLFGGVQAIGLELSAPREAGVES